MFCNRYTFYEEGLGRPGQRKQDAISIKGIALIALMMEAASTPETSANFYQTTRRNSSEDSHLNFLSCK
jgi:hypothetical protein